MADQQTSIPVETSYETSSVPVDQQPAKASSSKPDFQHMKQDARRVLRTVKALPKDRRWQLYAGVFLIFSVFFAQLTTSLFYIVFGIFVPMALGAIMVLGAYTGKNIVQEMDKKKQGPAPQVGKVEILEEEAIHEVEKK